MLKATRSSAGATGNPDWGSGRRSSAADGGGVAEGMEDDPVAPGSSHRRNSRGMGARVFMRPPPTVASSWATQRQADWETLEGVKERIVPRAARPLPFFVLCSFCDDTGVFTYPLVRVVPCTARVCCVAGACWPRSSCGRPCVCSSRSCNNAPTPTSPCT
ncbi:unnamed protein product [Ectocarpus sp. 13 AM-2016]